MSITIPCHHCGPRPVEEFVFGEILEPPENLDADGVALDRAYFHSNSKGEVRERWFHVYGCRRWTTTLRDTASDAHARLADDVPHQGTAP